MFVRWDNLTIETEQGSRLPGYREPAVVRHFDAPEALDVRFYEVRAKSALNRVPERSRMPFRWTVNPYRGCTHACVYCLAGDTAILMADGSTRALADVRHGDRIYGTRREGRYRRFVTTEVLAHWSTVKPAYGVRVEGGTDLVASGDHRFLTARGWKFVTGAGHGHGRRPHLTPGTRLLGTGGAAPAPEPTADYRRGYLCGMIRGDGHVGSYAYERPGRANGDVHRFRLALADGEALGRAEAYLEAESIRTTRFAFSAATERRRPIEAIRASAGATVDAIRALVCWPDDPSDDWRKGFLAGIFDAEGSCSQGVLRIPNTDAAIVGATTSSLERFGFDHVVEDRGLPNAIRTVRLRGGLAERMRFFALTGPAITRKRDIEGQAMKVRAEMRVESIEDLGVTMRDVRHHDGDRRLHRERGGEPQLLRSADAHLPRHGRRSRLRARDRRQGQRARGPARGARASIVEGRARRDGHEHRPVPVGREPLPAHARHLGGPARHRDAVLRPDEVAAAAPRSRPHAGDRAGHRHRGQPLGPDDRREGLAGERAAHPSPKARLEAVAELNRAGIPTGILVAPVMPGINDDPRQVERILEAAADAGATGVGGIALHLRGEVRGIFMEWLRSYRPDLVERYERLYRRGAYVPRAEQERIQGLLGSFRRRAAAGAAAVAAQPARLAAEGAARDARRGPSGARGQAGGAVLTRHHLAS